MKLEYVPRSLSRADTLIVVRELKSLEQTHGLIAPKAVVAAAKPKNSPLHKFFEWDDSSAAVKFREHQARILICNVYIRHADSEDSQPVRAFVNIKASSEDEEDESVRGYTSIENALTNVPMREQVLAYAKQQLIMWRAKFGAYEEFFGITKEIDKVTKPSKKSRAA